MLLLLIVPASPASQLENAFRVTVADKVSDVIVEWRLLDKISSNRCRFVRVVH